MAESELKDLFLTKGVSEEELKIILAQANGHAENGVYAYYSGTIKVEFSNKGKIKSIKGDPDAPLVDIVLCEIRDSVLIDHGIGFGKSILLNSLPVKGFYRYKDEFQIIPLPENPKYEPVGLYRNHPFILQFTYPTSSNDILDSFRRNKRKTELVNFLNLILQWGALDVNKSHKQHWVRVPKSWREPNKEEIELGITTLLPSSFDREMMHLQVGFDLPNEIATSNDFSNIEHLKKIKKINTDKYYASLGVFIDDVLDVPELIDKFLENYFDLKDKEKFHRSLYWLITAKETLDTSLSVSYICLIHAIEVFCESQLDHYDCKELGCSNKVLSSSQCATCGKLIKLGGPTAAFRDFIETHAKGIPHKLKSELYALRSEIAHGNILFSSDHHPYFAFDRLHDEQRDKYHIVRRIVKVCLLNWLLTNDQSK